MKVVTIAFTDKEYQRLLKIRRKIDMEKNTRTTWREFLIMLTAKRRGK